MTNNSELPNKRMAVSDFEWAWWPLFPLYPYGNKRTIVREIIRGQVWSFEQLQGLYYVAVPVRLTAVKVNGGLMLLNPLPPTKELLSALKIIEEEHGPVKTIVLPTASGLEHKISLPALARAFPKADLWVCPGQWSFPLSLPMDWIGIPRKRTKFLIEDGFPHEECCKWVSLGPIDIGLGNFQEVSCFHEPSGALLVTDSLIGIEAEPPSLFDLDPSPLLFHSRDRGDQPLVDTNEARRKGWARVVLFASFLRPSVLDIPPLSLVFRYAFRPGLRTLKAHFGLFPFSWKEGWEDSAKELIGEKGPKLQIAPVLERLVFPRSKETIMRWLDELSRLSAVKQLVSAHFSPLVPLNKNKIKGLKKDIDKANWARSDGNFRFLSGLDKSFLKLGVVPNDPLKRFKVLNHQDQ